MQCSPRQLLERRVWRLFHKGIKDYSLIEEGDHILIGLSGGKDSLALTELLSGLARIQRPQFSVDAVHIRVSSADYATDTSYLEAFARKCVVPIHFRTISLLPDRQEKRTPCFLCSWNRRKTLFQTAQELGCNKVALGHHMDDILHTLLMNELYEGQFSTMPVRLRMQRIPLTIIRPLCRVHEADLSAWAEWHGYEAQVKRCPYEQASRRTSARQLMEQIEKMSPEARYSLWHALEVSGKLMEG